MVRRYIEAWGDNWTGKEIEPDKVSHIEITVDGVSVELDLDKSTPMFQTLGRLHAKGEPIGKGSVRPIKSAPSVVRKAPKRPPRPPRQPRARARLRSPRLSPRRGNGPRTTGPPSSAPGSPRRSLRPTR